MATVNQLALHPTDAALVGAAQVTQRGARPLLMATADDTLIKYNSWLQTQSGYGPNGELGVFEEDITTFLNPLPLLVTVR